MAVRFQLLCFLLRRIAIGIPLVSASNKTSYSGFCVGVQLVAKPSKTDLKSADLYRSWGFKSPSGHQKIDFRFAWAHLSLSFFSGIGPIRAPWLTLFLSKLHFRCLLSRVLTAAMHYRARNALQHHIVRQLKWINDFQERWNVFEA